MDVKDIPDPSRAGYEAYRDFTNGKSLATGQPIPPWEELPEMIQYAWAAAYLGIMKATKEKDIWKAEQDAKTVAGLLASHKENFGPK